MIDQANNPYSSTIEPTKRKVWDRDSGMMYAGGLLGVSFACIIFAACGFIADIAFGVAGSWIILPAFVIDMSCLFAAMNLPEVEPPNNDK